MANNTSPSTVKDNSLTSPFTDHIFRFQSVSERFAYRQLRMINKAAGSDDTCSAIKRQCRCNRSPRSITHLIDLSLSSARFLNEWQNAKVAPTVEPRFDEPLYNESPRYRRFCSYACCDGDSLIILVLQNSVATLIAGQADLWPKRSLWISFCWSRSYWRA